MNLLRSAKTTGCTEFGVANLLKLVYQEICKKHGMQRLLVMYNLMLIQWY